MNEKVMIEFASFTYTLEEFGTDLGFNPRTCRMPIGNSGQMAQYINQQTKYTFRTHAIF